MSGREANLTCPDLSAPPRLSNDQARVLNPLHDDIAESWQNVLADIIPHDVEVHPLPVETPVEFSAETTKAGTVPFSISPHGVSGLLWFDLALAYALLESGLGSDRISQPLTRPLSAVETSVLTRIIDPLLQQYERHWRKLADVTFAPLPLSEQESLLVDLNSGQMLQWWFEVSLLGATLRIGIFLPARQTTPLLDHLTLQNWIAGGEQPSAPESDMVEAVKSSRVMVQATLGTVSISLGELSDLSAGSVLLLPGLDEDIVSVRIADQPKFTGKVRRVRGSLVVELSTPYAPEEAFLP